MKKVINTYQQVLDKFLEKAILGPAEKLGGYTEDDYCELCNQAFEPLSDVITICDECAGEHTYRCDNCTMLFESKDEKDDGEQYCDECQVYEDAIHESNIGHLDWVYYNG